MTDRQINHQTGERQPDERQSGPEPTPAAVVQELSDEELVHLSGGAQGNPDASGSGGQGGYNLLELNVGTPPGNDE